MWPDETVVPLTNLPTAHPTEESEPATPVVAPASQDTPDHAEDDGERSAGGESPVQVGREVQGRLGEHLVLDALGERVGGDDDGHVTPRIERSSSVIGCSTGADR